jgi:hypothetical protein
MVVSVKSVAGAADTSEQGDKVYRAIIAAMDATELVTLSFDGVQTATSSFVNASFVELLAVFPFSEIKRRLRVVSSNRQINNMVMLRMGRESTRTTSLTA